jgi:hypothetical protein
LASSGASEGIGVEVTMLLCDAAQSVGGKLYVLGGGWSQVPATALAQGQSMALAVYLAVPWDRANESFEVVARLTTEDGDTVHLPGLGEGGSSGPMETRGQLEVGRPPGLKRGTPLDSTVALNFAGLPLGPGGYVWQFLVNDEVKARTPFRVLG